MSTTSARHGDVSNAQSQYRPVATDRARQLLSTLLAAITFMVSLAQGRTCTPEFAEVRGTLALVPPCRSESIYHDDHQALPAGVTTTVDPTWTYTPLTGATNRAARDLPTSTGWSFFALILPNMEKDPFYRQIRLDLPVSDPLNRAARETIVKGYTDPGDLPPRLVNVGTSGDLVAVPTTITTSTPWTVMNDTDGNPIQVASCSYAVASEAE